MFWQFTRKVDSFVENVLNELPIVLAIAYSIELMLVKYNQIILNQHSSCPLTQCLSSMNLSTFTSRRF